MIYALIILLFFGVILNKLSKKYALYKLTYKRNISKSVVEIDEEFEITTIIENDKIIPVLFLQVVEKIPSLLSYKFKVDLMRLGEQVQHTTTMFLMPRQRIKRTYKVFLTERGLYSFKDVTLISGDFLGMSTITTQQEYLQEVVVYPRNLDIEKELKPFGSYYGDISVRRWIISDPILTIGIREYTGYEPQKSIHWPSSLKTGRLMVKNYDYTTDNKVMLVFSIECARPFWTDIDTSKIEKCFSITRAIMEELEGMGIPYGFVTNIRSNIGGIKESYVPYGHGVAHFYDLLEFLGRATYNISIFFEKILENLTITQDKSVTYVIIIPKLLKEYVDAVNQLGINAGKIIVISLEDENLNLLNEKIISYIGKEC